MNAVDSVLVIKGVFLHREMIAHGFPSYIVLVQNNPDSQKVGTLYKKSFFSSEMCHLVNTVTDPYTVIQTS